MPRRNRLLFVSAEPIGADPLDHDKERADLDEPLRARGVDFAPNQVETTREKLVAALAKYAPSILHVSCHGSENPKPPALLFEDAYKGPDAVSPPSFAAIATRHKSLNIIVLSVCRSSHHVEAIVAARPGVVAIGFTERVRQDLTRTFCRTFYTRLGAGDTVGDAFAQAKLALPDALSDQVMMRGPGDIRLPEAAPWGGRIRRLGVRALLGASALGALGLLALVALRGTPPGEDPPIETGDRRPRIRVEFARPDDDLPKPVVYALFGPSKECPPARSDLACTIDHDGSEKCPRKPPPCEPRLPDHEGLKEQILTESVDGLNEALLPFHFTRGEEETEPHTLCLAFAGSTADQPLDLAQRVQFVAQTGPCSRRMPQRLLLSTFAGEPAKTLGPGDLKESIVKTLSEGLAVADEEVLSAFAHIPFEADFMVDFWRQRAATSLGFETLESRGTRPIDRGNAVFGVFLDETQEGELLFKVCNATRVAGPLTDAPELSCRELTRTGLRWPRAPTLRGSQVFLRSWRGGWS